MSIHYYIYNLNSNCCSHFSHSFVICWFICIFVLFFSAVNQMVSGVQQCRAALLEYLKHQMSNMIETHSGNLGQLKSDIMGVFDQFNYPFSKKKTTHLQDKTIKELLQPAEPEMIVSKKIQYVMWKIKILESITFITYHCWKVWNNC